MDSGNILQMTPLRKIGSERCLTYAAESSSITFKRVGFFSCNYLRLKHSSVLTLNLFIVDPPPTPATHKKNSLIITQTHTTTFSFHVGNLVLQCLFTCSAFLFVILYYIRCLFAFFCHSIVTRHFVISGPVWEKYICSCYFIWNRYHLPIFQLGYGVCCNVFISLLYLSSCFSVKTLFFLLLWKHAVIFDIDACLWGQTETKAYLQHKLFLILSVSSTPHRCR